MRTSLAAAVLTATAIGGAVACAADDQSAATSTAGPRAASWPSPTPGTPAFLAQQLVGKPNYREAAVPVGRAAREFLMTEGGVTYPKEQCEGQWQLLTVEQKIAVHRGGFMDGCMNPA
ncbi:hypothetical protein ACFQ6N_04420 [Kitasatospora sp. NPDC056446]|uniref:hypothetical protein n=1 Tax=Kitasatospora sp. NPDC056446 TaxID=3345819 RepID=UPI0036AFCD27